MELYFILVAPKVPENIGASARAIKTMGFRNLRLVRPENFPDEKAFHVAHGSNDILHQAKIFETLEKATSDLDFIVGTSAKKRSIKYDYYPLKDLAVILNKKGNHIKKTGLVFGKEESGLSNRDLEQCDLVTFIPLHAPYPSLNLGQAVMLTAYELSGLHHETKKESHSGTGYKQLRQKVSIILEKTGILEGSVKYNRIMERLAITGADDINLLHTIGNALINSLEKNGEK